MTYRNILFFLICALVVVICFDHHRKDDGNTVYIGIAWTYNKNNLFVEGAEFAASEINEAGGVLGKKIKLIVNDKELKVSSMLEEKKSVLMAGDKIKNPTRAIANDFIKSSRKIAAVVGHRFSYMAVPAAVLYYQAKMLFIAPTATDEILTSMNFDNVFRLLAKNSKEGEQLALYSAAKKIKRAAVFYERSASQVELNRYFRRTAEIKGISIVSQYSFFGDTYNLPSNIADLKKIHTENPIDAVFIFANDKQSVDIIDEFCKRYLSKFHFITGHSGNTAAFWKEISNIQNKYNSVIQISAPSLFNQHPINADFRKFSEKFSKEYHRIPDQYAALGYDAINIITFAANQANSIESKDIAREVHYMPACRGITGKIAFDEQGDLVDKLYAMQVATPEGFDYYDINGKPLEGNYGHVNNLPECSSMLKKNGGAKRFVHSQD